MYLRIIKSNEEFRNLRNAWNKLLQDSSNKAITQTWEWLYTWWEYYGNERKLFIIVGFEDSKIIGIAPFAVQNEDTEYFKLFHYKTIWLLGSGKTTDRNITSDYLDLIILQGKEKAFVNALIKFIVDLHNWDEIILENISSESIVLGLLKKAAQSHGLIFQITKTAPSILIKLPDNWDAYLKSIHSSLRYKIRRGRKEFSKLKGTYHLVRSESELHRAFNDLETLHQYRWQNKGQPGAFSSPTWKAFHKKIMPLMFKNGWLKLSFLKLDGIPVAANYNFVYDNKIHFFQSGLIPHENKHIRVGLLLHSYCIEEAINEGYIEYDFLKVGGKGAGYKEMWGNYSRDLLEIRLSKCSNKENAYRLFSCIFNFIKKIRHKIELKI